MAQADPFDTRTLVVSYGFRYDHRRRCWHVTRDGVTVHHARTLLECENWVTRGGADRHEKRAG